MIGWLALGAVAGLVGVALWWAQEQIDPGWRDRDDEEEWYR